MAGGTGANVCDLARKGERVIALSQELLSWSVIPGTKNFKPYSRARLEQVEGDDPRCNGEFIVVDAMNARFRNRGDLFFLTRGENTSCKAKIYLIK